MGVLLQQFYRRHNHCDDVPDVKANIQEQKSEF